MTTYFVSRHPGAKAWAKAQGIDVDEVIDHLDIARVQAGDKVLGTLPVNLAAEVCAKGAEYWHLSLKLPPEARGVELSDQDMVHYGAKLERFTIIKE